MHNIIFSTTRQWNPGDEFILKGIRNILLSLGMKHNAVIFNRNPDVRSCYQDRQFLKNSKLPFDFNGHPDLIDVEANFKFGFFDNSVKPNSDCSYADLVVFAGTPEWCNGKLFDLYETILRYNLPVLIVGVGGGCDLYRENYREVISGAKLLTVRDRQTLDAARAQGFAAHLLPCPALLSAPLSSERVLHKAERIGLVYQATRDESVIWNGFDRSAYDYMMSAYRALLAKNGMAYEFEIVCHYVDELPLAKRDFPQLRMHYSYDSEDYFSIYSRFDLVIGSRVHGIGVSASLGIPGIALIHDSRGGTCEGFLAKAVPIGEDIDKFIASFDQLVLELSTRNQSLIDHKAKVFQKYRELVAAGLQDLKIEYSRTLPIAPEVRPALQLHDLVPLVKVLRELRIGTIDHSITH